MAHRKGLFWLASILGASLIILSSGVAFGTNSNGEIPSDPENPQEPMVGCDNAGDIGTIGQVYADLGQPVGVPVYIGSSSCVNNFRFEFVIPTGLEYDSVTGAAWTLGFDDPAFVWNPTTRHLIISHMTGGSPCLTPNINNAFIRIWFSTCSGAQHNVFKYITWVPNPTEPGSQPLNWLGSAGCSNDPINTMNMGWVFINQISITFDISEETALIGDTVLVTVNCTNSYLFDEFAHYWIQYDANKLEPTWPLVFPTSRTDGYLSDPSVFSPYISVYGTRPGGYGTSTTDGAAFYKLRFKVISPLENTTAAITWVPSTLVTTGAACHQNLNGLTPCPVTYLPGSVTVPEYRALVDFGNAAGSNNSGCDSVKVPILLNNNFRVNGFQLVIDYGDYNDPNWDAIGIISADPLGWPLNFSYQLCSAGKYAIVSTLGAPAYPVSSTPVTIGWLVLKYTSSTLTPTYTVQLVDTDCQPYNDGSWLATNDQIRGWTQYTLSTAQFDGAPGTVVIGPPLAQVNIPGAAARFMKPGYYYQSFAYSGIDLKSNVDLDSVWFTLTWDASKFCMGFSALSPNALVVSGNGTAYIRVSNVKSSMNYQRYGTIRVDNNRSTDQTGSFTVSGASARSKCDHSAINTTGAGGGIHVGPGGASICANSIPAENMLKPAMVPERFELMQNYPNPFNASTVINFDLAEPGPTTLEVYNIMGQHVATLFDSYTEAGPYSIRWDGTDTRGQTVATGVYLYRLQSGKMTASKKMVLLK